MSSESSTDSADGHAALRRGRLLVLAAALLWSTSGLFMKSPPLAALPQETGGLVVACFRALAAALMLAPVVRWKQARFRPGLIPMVVAFAAMNLLFITAMTLTTAAAAIFLQYTGIVWAAVLGVFLLGERLDRGGVVAAVCALAGIGWIVAAAGAGQLAGTVVGLASGLSYGCVVLMLRFLRDEDSSWLVLLNLACAGLLLLPWVLPLKPQLTAGQWGLIVLLGLFQMGVPYVLFARGVRTLRSQEASLLALIEPILNPLWVWLCWGEAADSATLTGGALILLGLGLKYTIFLPGGLANRRAVLSVAAAEANGVTVATAAAPEPDQTGSTDHSS